MINVAARARRHPVACLTALLAGAFSGCEPEPPLDLYGSLYFEAGPYLGEFRLATGDAMPVVNLGDQRIQRVSVFEHDELLLSVLAYVEERPHDRVVRFDIETLHETPLVGGQAAEYLAGPAQVAFYAGRDLIVAPRRNVRGGGRVIHSDARREPPTLVAMGDAGLLFAGDDGEIRRYDPATGSTERLEGLSSACELRDAVWLADREQLLCRARQTDRSVPVLSIARLDGQRAGVLPLPEGRAFRPVAYLPDQRILILNERHRAWISRHEEHRVWAYAMDSGRLQRIADDQYLGESAVYRADAR